MLRKFTKNQRGSATMIVLAVVLIVIIGLALWYALRHHNSPVATTPAQKTADSACLKLYNDPIICDFSINANDFQTTSYTATATSSASGVSSTYTFKNDGKGNDEITIASGGQSSSFITLGGATYSQQPGGSWVKYPSSSPAPTTSNPTSNVKFNFTDKSDLTAFKKLDTESCGSLTCVKYQVTDPSSPGSTFTIWIDTAHYQLVRWQGTSNGTTLDMSFSYGPVTISTPSPITAL
jgi:hypothetical protein